MKDHISQINAASPLEGAYILALREIDIARPVVAFIMAISRHANCSAIP
jgi:hypothetical protein